MSVICYNNIGSTVYCRNRQNRKETFNLLKYIFIALAVIIIGGAVFAYFKTSGIAKKVYRSLLVRDSKDKWQRVCSAPENEEQITMWNDGLTWAEENKSAMSEAETENEGLHLVGEYYDFGSDSAVIIFPGRCECLKYSYHYARPYADAGLNVLVIDSRCHGLSDGEYTTIGVAEGRDAIAWAKYLEEKKNIEKIFFHGVCIGGAAAMFAVSSDELPKSVTAMVSEGCFVNFRESFKNHMIHDKRSLFPVLDMVMHEIKKHTGVDVLKDCPLNAAPKAKVPALFIFGEKDIFSVPEKSRILIDAYGGEKTEKWLPKGGHSHLRINNTEEYDKTVIDFVSSFRQ